MVYLVKQSYIFSINKEKKNIKNVGNLIIVDIELNFKLLKLKPPT